MPLAVANAVNQAYQGWQILIAPEKIVFDVAPRAAITDMTTSSGERTLYADSGSDFLRLYGTNLVDQTDTGYYPDLVLSDRSGNTARMAITESQVHDASDFSWTDLRITVNELTPLIDQLGGSRFDVTLEMDHADYSGFPDGVLPLPGTHFDWIGDARLIGTGSGLHEYSLALEGYEGYLIGVESTVMVMAADTSYLRFLDNGARQDDEMDLVLLDANGEPIDPNGQTGSVLLPTLSGDRDVSIGWVDSELTNSEGEPLDLDKVQIACLDGSDDGVCTVRLKGEIYINGVVQEIDRQYTLAEQETAF